jgi:hypothetical protein
MKSSSFRIRLADTHYQRNEVGELLDRMYSRRGYQSSGSGHAHPHRVTLIASAEENTLATITVGFDSGAGLLADELYKAEIDLLRRRGKRLCEFIKLAVDGGVKSKQVLAAIFHICHIYAREVTNHSDLFIEVNPRHVAFYQRMLGFVQLGEERMNMRVNAPAVLLWVDLDFVDAKIREFGGRPEAAATEKSLFPYAFSQDEQRHIATQLRDLHEE